MDTIVSDNLTVCSVFYQDSNTSDLARIVNCDLAMNDLSTFNTSKEIWLDLNRRYIEKFGHQDCIKNDVTISNITWACTTLSAYLSWSTIKDYYNDINGWITKINLINHETSALPASESASTPPASLESMSALLTSESASTLPVLLESTLALPASELASTSPASLESILVLPASESASTSPASLKSTSALPVSESALPPPSSLELTSVLPASESASTPPASLESTSALPASEST